MLKIGYLWIVVQYILFRKGVEIQKRIVLVTSSVPEMHL